MSTPNLTAQDRCDTCGAQALVAATVKGTVLMYCGNHSRKYEARLRPLATVWVDDRDSTNSFVLELTEVG